MPEEELTPESQNDLVLAALGAEVDAILSTVEAKDPWAVVDEGRKFAPQHADEDVSVEHALSIASAAKEELDLDLLDAETLRTYLIATIVNFQIEMALLENCPTKEHVQQHIIVAAKSNIHVLNVLADLIGVRNAH